MSKVLAILAALLLGFLPLSAPAQSYSPSGAASVTNAGVVPAAVSLSTACATPLAPTTCAATSFVIFNLATNGGADYSYQINAMSGGTLAFESSNDGVNFFPSNLTISGGVASSLAVATSTTVAGKFNGIGGSAVYSAIVVTTAPTSAVTVYPYISQRNAGIAIHGSIPLSLTPIGVGSDTAFPTSISTTGTSLGTLPTGSKGVEIDIPPGASVTYYVAATIAASASAATTIAHTYANAANATTPFALQVNIANGQQVWVTSVVAGTATTFVSGLPTFRGI